MNNHSIEIILFQPQIPQNTGNIVRTCAVTGCRLLLVRPLGFSTQSRWLKRAGLDYWEGVDVQEIDDLCAYLEKNDRTPIFFTSKGKKSHFEIDYPKNASLIFGSETSGLPSKITNKWPENLVKIPMLQEARCLNLATSVGIGVYECLRKHQNNPANLLLDSSIQTKVP